MKNIKIKSEEEIDNNRKNKIKMVVRNLPCLQYVYH